MGVVGGERKPKRVGKKRGRAAAVARREATCFTHHWQSENVLAGQTSITLPPDPTFSSQVPGFWQYGSISWSTFSTRLDSLIRTDHQWAIFDLDEDHDSPGRHGAQKPLYSVIVPPVVYILPQPGKQAPLRHYCYDIVLTLISDESPKQVALSEETARPRQPTHSNTPARVSPLPLTYTNNIKEWVLARSLLPPHGRERDLKF
jgi:hypothetical protein